MCGSVTYSIFPYGNNAYEILNRLLKISTVKGAGAEPVARSVGRLRGRAFYSEIVFISCTFFTLNISPIRVLCDWSSVL